MVIKNENKQTLSRLQKSSLVTNYKIRKCTDFANFPLFLRSYSSPVQSFVSFFICLNDDMKLHFYCAIREKKKITYLNKYKTKS